VVLDEDNVGNTANSQSREHRKFPASVRQHIPASEGKPIKRKQVLFSCQYNVLKIGKKDRAQTHILWSSCPATVH